MILMKPSGSFKTSTLAVPAVCDAKFWALDAAPITLAAAFAVFMMKDFLNYFWYHTLCISDVSQKNEN
jgi:hypothetical protein